MNKAAEHNSNRYGNSPPHAPPSIVTSNKISPIDWPDPPTASCHPRTYWLAARQSNPPEKMHTIWLRRKKGGIKKEKGLVIGRMEVWCDEVTLYEWLQVASSSYGVTDAFKRDRVVSACDWRFWMRIFSQASDIIYSFTASDTTTGFIFWSRICPYLWSFGDEEGE